MKNKVVVANLMRDKTKQAFFALHQIHTKMLESEMDCEPEFHILWDNEGKEEKSKWSDLIDNYGFDITPYTRSYLNDYCRIAYGVSDKDIKRFDNFYNIYHILLPHYLRRVLLKSYYLIYDDDILINTDFKDVLQLLIDEVPILIYEPFNQNCDKVCFQRLSSSYGEKFVNIYKYRNPNLLGFNSGFEGIDLVIYDDWLSTDRFVSLLSLFDYSGIIGSDGNEIWGEQRTALETQQQSFCSLMNVARSRKHPHILNEKEYYVVPNWSWGPHPVFGKINEQDGMGGWGLCLSSKISHFIGHTQGKGKPQPFLDRVDMYLKEKGYL